MNEKEVEEFIKGSKLKQDVKKKFGLSLPALVWLSLVYEQYNRGMLEYQEAVDKLGLMAGDAVANINNN